MDGMEAGRRETVVTQTRTALDFAEILRYTADVLYPRAEILIIMSITFQEII